MTRRDWLRYASAVPVLAAGLRADDTIPAHPQDLKFKPLVYDPPEPDGYRHELPNGAVAYLVEDHTLPLVDVSALIRGGAYLTPRSSWGLAQMTGSQMRVGGTVSISPRDLDEELAFLASDIGTSFGDTSGSASMSCLKANLDRTLELFFDVLKNPRFDEQRFQLAGHAHQRDRGGVGQHPIHDRVQHLRRVAEQAGCGGDDPTAPADLTATDGSIYQRPEFIDTRPEAEQLAHTLTAADVFAVAPTTEKDAGKYALVIGISDYEGTVNDLTYCDDDAVDWRNYLQGQGYTVTTLIDGAATRAAIEAAVATLAAQSIAGNEIVFTYSGHGSRGNMISSDLTYISNAWFGGMFAGVASTKMAFNFDACQIGAFGTALNAPGRVIALASDTKRYSYDGTADMANGVFTYYQMVGFDQQGFVFAEDDDAYAVAEMFAWAKTYHVKVAPYYIDAYEGSLDY